MFGRHFSLPLTSAEQEMTTLLCRGPRKLACLAGSKKAGKYTVSKLRGLPGTLERGRGPLVYAKRFLCGIKSQENQSPNVKETAPLSGIRVLDLSRILAGPYATMVLGDLGAEVLKIERPGSGDFTRLWGPPFCGEESAYFLSINRNKKSVSIDFQKPEGQKLVKELAKKSDVVIENFLPGKLDEMGLGYDELSRDSPGLIYCSITGYGNSGPYRSRGGFDVVAAAMGGLMHITGPEDGEPCRVGVAITDIATGLYAHGAIIAAIFERMTTGKGRKIDCSLLSTQIAVLCHVAVNYLNAGVDLGRTGTGHHSIVPYQAFRTKDGYFVVGAGNDVQFAKLCKILEHPDLSERREFATNALRVANRKELIAIMSEVFLERTNKQWLERFDGCQLPYGPINNLQQAMSDPQVEHLGLVMKMDHPTAGNIKMPGPATFFDGKALLREPLPPPLLGQHTEQVLRDVLELDHGEIAELMKGNVISSHKEASSACVD